MPKAVRVARWLFTRALLLLLVINGVMFFQQPRITFYPFSPLEATPAQWGLPYEDVQLMTADNVRLHGWYLPHPAASDTLLFLHGNGGNISHRRESLAIFHRLGLNVLIIDYRGYGQSEGSPGEQGLYLDALAAWDYLTRQRGTSADQIIIFGRSLGGAVATELATQVSPAALILESTFSSARDMAREFFPRLSYLVLLRYRFDSEAKIAKVKAPLLMLHSAQDEIIPYPLGRKLYAAATQPKCFVELRGGHNGGFLQSQPDYEIGLMQFIRGLNTKVTADQKV
jgi:fermentation-respiration switch protein FrsA (DUF1100 family)